MDTDHILNLNALFVKHSSVTITHKNRIEKVKVSYKYELKEHVAYITINILIYLKKAEKKRKGKREVK